MKRYSVNSNTKNRPSILLYFIAALGFFIVLIAIAAPKLFVDILLMFVESLEAVLGKVFK